MKNALGIFQNVAFSLSLPEIRGICLSFSQSRYGGVPAVKTHENARNSVRPWLHDFFTLKLVHTYLLASQQNYHLNVLPPYGSNGLCSKEADFGSFTVFTCLPRFWDIHLPFNLKNIL